ncbi:beta/gamma crystallin domain-containing protein [Chromobacterium sp. IIBBL 290-4]|uniref:beta/gamma crystallin domain-containing protein n=1 Tax=Chromobacterium sp. IIBBL 290-4 TaxID=2953890 RepID=UPI0020B8FD49|nr:beta/gamma crystallin domain-containing protein [Chromobacterium sp. IIBBL 290-4]UTH73378.1 beta/gamma crystallin domain-containing protein [Chromobacterium sp. IIBBL 290-4]
MALLPDQIAFFRTTNLQGEPDYYHVGDDVTFDFGDNFNDKYKSVEVGETAKVRCYQHINGSGLTHEYQPGRHQNIDAQISGLSKFQVLALDTAFAVGLKLHDKTGGEPGDYKMVFEAADIGRVEVPSGLDEYVFLPSSSSTNETTCAIYVFDRSGVAVATGAVFFHWDQHTHEIQITTHQETFPANMTYTRDDQTRASFYLESIKK